MFAIRIAGLFPLTRRAAGFWAMILDADSRYRLGCQLRGTSDEHLADMGMTRDDAARAFRH